MSVPIDGTARRRALHTSPLLRLIAGGAVLFAASVALDAWRGRTPDGTDAGSARDAAPSAVVRAPVVIDASTAHALERGFVARFGRPPGPAERRALLGEAAQDEMLYREARVLQLGHDDASVRRRLLELLRTLGEPRAGRDDDQLVEAALRLGLDDDVIVRRLLTEKMRLVLQREPHGTPLDDALLADALARHRAELVQPESVSVEQVFLSTERRGDAAPADARRLARLLRAGTSPTRSWRSSRGSGRSRSRHRSGCTWCASSSAGPSASPRWTRLAPPWSRSCAASAPGRTSRAGSPGYASSTRCASRTAARRTTGARRSPATRRSASVSPRCRPRR